MPASSNVPNGYLKCMVKGHQHLAKDVGPSEIHSIVGQAAKSRDQSRDSFTAEPDLTTLPDIRWGEVRIARPRIESNRKLSWEYTYDTAEHRMHERPRIILLGRKIVPRPCKYLSGDEVVFRHLRKILVEAQTKRLQVLGP